MALGGESCSANTTEMMPKRREKLRLMDLPVEALMTICKFIEDTDLQTLSRVNRTLRTLSTDVRVLWRKHIFGRRNPSRVQHALFDNPQRPDRCNLHSLNILRGPARLATRIREGAYINDADAKRSYDAQTKLRWLIVRRTLDRRLGVQLRPCWNELVLRGVVPVEAIGVYGSLRSSDSTQVVFSLDDTPILNVWSPTPSCSRALIPTVMDLQRALRKDRIKQQLNKRPSIEDVQASGVLRTPAQSRQRPVLNPILLAKQLTLERALLRSRLRERLVARPSLEDLGSVLHLDTPASALMLCPPIRPKLRFYESLQRPNGKC
ncbi:hypothetical protein BJ742DRAFT_510485 [Cladochytrium replicatum]|nr:hypothetical protein BJ742DRAFT_510485 [Cladochytrium replicatum]